MSRAPFSRSVALFLSCAVFLAPFAAAAQSEAPHFRFGTTSSGAAGGGPGSTPSPETPPGEELPTAPSLDVSGVPTSGRVDEPYFGTAHLGGSATTLTVTNTPHGVRTLGETLSGYPTDEGVYTVNFVARADDGQTASASVPVTIEAADHFVLDLSGIARSGRVGDYYYSMIVSQGGSDVTYKVLGTTLEDMGLQPISSYPGDRYGLISGFLTTEGEFDLLVEARSADGTTRTGIRTVTVFPAEIDPLHPELPNPGPYIFASDRMRVGQQMLDPEGWEGYAEIWLSNWNYGSSETFTVASGSLPPGISIGGWGRFQGTATQQGVYTFSIRAEVYSGGVLTASGVTTPFTITVGPPLPSGIKASINTTYAQFMWQGFAERTNAAVQFYDGTEPYTHEPFEILSQTGGVTISNQIQNSNRVNRIFADWTSPGEAIVRACASDTTGSRICRSVRLAATFAGFDASLSFPNRNLTCSVASGYRAAFSYDVLVDRSPGHTAPITIESEFHSRELAPYNATSVTVTEISGGYRVSGLLDSFNETVAVKTVIRDSLGMEIMRRDNSGFTVSLGDCTAEIVLGGPFTVEWNTAMTTRNVGWESQLVGVRIRNAWGRVEWIAESHPSNCQVPEYRALWSDKQDWQTRQIWLMGAQTGCYHLSAESRSAAQTYFYRDSLGRVRETNTLYINFTY